MPEPPTPDAGAEPAAADLRRSALHDRHVALGAKFAPFGGWEMPLEYAGGGVVKEHKAVRSSVGVFDVSHLGTLRVRGEAAAEFVNRCLSNDLGRIRPGQAQYTLACDDASGGIVDDLIVYLVNGNDLVLVPNAANAAEVARRLRAAAPEPLELLDLHAEEAILAVQGPRSDELLTALQLPAGHDYMSFASGSFGDVPLVVCRSGYTGERGYELVTPARTVGVLWDAILSAGEAYDISPCGLAARDTLRTEMGYPLHGQDISLDVTPVAARLRWAVGWDKPSFWGRSVLLEQREKPPRQVLTGLLATGRGIPRARMPVSAPDGSVAGKVTSGTYSPSLRKGVGLALVDRELPAGSVVSVDVRGRAEPFTLSKPPFVASHVRDD